MKSTSSDLQRRDIIARSLGKMDISVFPVLAEVLKTAQAEQIREVLDAIGFMVFYHPRLADRKNAEYILRVMDIYKEDEIIVWKSILCLSAFPLSDSVEVLNSFICKR